MTDLPQWPHLEATCYTSGNAEIVINGTSHAIDTDSSATARREITERAAHVAASLDRPVRTTVIDYNETQTLYLFVSPDGTIEADPDKPVDSHKTAATTVESLTSAQDKTNNLPSDPAVEDMPTRQTASSEQKGNSTPDGEPPTLAEPAQPQTRRQARESFLNQAKRDWPATQGVRGALARLGIRVQPSASEQAERDDVHKVSQHWAGPRTIAVVNGKGGANKTPTSILLSAVLARYGGGGVLAWDNNQTRGTLGWRTEQAEHDATLLDLLPAADRLLSPGAQLGELAHFTHHQTADRFDVLRSKPKLLADAQRFTQDDVDTIHSVAAKFYRLIIIDSGNDESDALWQQMIKHTDQLVVATTTSDEKAEAGALLLENLADDSNHGQRLADNAVVIVSQAEADAKPRDLNAIATGFQALARDVVTIPYDPAIVNGHLRYAALRNRTQRAWLRASAAVANGLRT